MRFEIIKDYDYIYECLTLPHVWRVSTDDNCPPMGLFFVPMNDKFIWIKADEYGLLLLVKQFNGTHEIHVAMKEGIIGNKLKGIIEQAIEWGYNHIVELNDMVAKIPSFNHKAQGLARRIGFGYQGIDDKPFVKDGIKYDQHIYIFRKENICLGQQR